MFKWQDSGKGREQAANSEKDEMRDTLNLEGFGNVGLCFCFYLEGE